MRIIGCEKNHSRSSSMGNKLTEEICARHVLVFGDEIQKKISSLTIGVVSVGGLGIAVIDQLMRLFPRKLIFIDKDRVELSNLNRLIGATLIDASLGTRKVDLAYRNIRQFNPDQEAILIHGDFLEKENQKRFRECDFIFGASDSNAVRLAANRLCLAHGIPYLDCAVGAVVGKGQLEAAGGQVIKILPDSGFCLHCADLFNMKDSMNEFLSDSERKRQENQGYIKGARITAPQVYSLNMVVAGWAVWMFMRMISGEQLDFDGIAIDARHFKTETWKESVGEISDCPTCGENGIVFAGDDADLLIRESCGSQERLSDFIITAGPEGKCPAHLAFDGYFEAVLPSYRGLIIGEEESYLMPFRMFLAQ